jgi:glycosyltransferase involved in cell wall biosynthesis
MRSGKDDCVEDTLICFSHLRWNFVYQRPQHLLSRAARNASVYFLEEPIFVDAPRPELNLTTEAEGVIVAVPVLPSSLKDSQIARAQQKQVHDLLLSIACRRRIAWYYTPMALPFSRHLAFDLSVYDNMDELSAFAGAHPDMLTLEQEMFRRADLVFTGGQSLYEAKRSRHDNMHAFPSGIDVMHFGKARMLGLTPPADQDHLPRPRLGFFGVIDERMDLALLYGAADLRPDWHFVMVGPVVKIDPATLPQRPNIHWIGGRKYQDLPAYLSGWDVGIMPFAVNEFTRYISPTKTPEFLAAGVPVVSTPVPDVVNSFGDLGLVEIASTPQEFIAKSEQLLTRPKTAWLQKVDAHLSTMSWNLIWERMDLLMQRALNARPRAVVSAEAGEMVRV